MALGRLGGHFIENANILAGDERRIHEQKSAVGADNVSGGLQVDGFALGEAAADLHGNLQGEADGSTTLWVAGSLHKKVPWKGLSPDSGEMLTRKVTEGKNNKDLELIVLKGLGAEGPA